MNTLFVKICGITTAEDAQAAVESGADALGFNFYPKSKRYISPDRAAVIIKSVPAKILAVGVFVNPDKEDVRDAIQKSRINVLQFSGDEKPEHLSGFKIPIIKAIHITDRASVEKMKSFVVDSYLLDTFSSDDFGGTGKQFHWEIAMEAKRYGKIIVAGGLTPENVSDLVRNVRPYGVDVSSGVELRPGIKDHQKVKAFIRRAREAHFIH
jgi:phosphoribosylanthranilate isomerase